MGIVLLVLLLALLFGGAGFAMRSGETARWYRW